MRRTTSLLLAALASLSWLVAACTDGNADAHAESHDQEHAATAERPQVTFRAGNDQIELPDEVPSGYVDIRIEALDSGDAHLLIRRLSDDLTFEEYDAAVDDDPAMFTDVHGNGTVHPGGTVLLTADLEPGNWIVDNIYIPEGADEPEFAGDRFVVVESDNDASAPREDGVVVLGPGMSVDAPESFAVTGVWKFENHDDAEMHEAAIVGLADGTTKEDAIAWFADQQGPPPIAGDFGGMGALGPGNEAWITFSGGGLEPGHYSLMCWIPNLSTFIPHVMSGMFEEFDVEES